MLLMGMVFPPPCACLVLTCHARRRHIGILDKGLEEGRGQYLQGCWWDGWGDYGHITEGKEGGLTGLDQRDASALHPLKDAPSNQPRSPRAKDEVANELAVFLRVCVVCCTVRKGTTFVL